MVRSPLKRLVDQIYGRGPVEFTGSVLTRVLDATTRTQALKSFRERYDVEKSTAPYEWGVPPFPNWPAYDQTVNAKSLLTAAQGYDKPDIDVKKEVLGGVMFHYGVSNQEFVVAVSMCSMRWENKPVPDLLTYDTVGMPFYQIKADGHLELANRTTWRNKYWKDKYVQHIRIRTDIGQPEYYPVDLMDTEAEVFLFGELKSVYAKNARELDSDFFVVTCAVDSSADSKQENYHRVAIHLRSGATDWIDDLEHDPYVMRALELGSPCPPRCKEFVFK